MPHATLKLIPGVDQNRTLALNEAAISTTQLVRFVPDKQGLGLVQKLGGWTKYYGASMGSIVRALWPWEDTNGSSYLAAGAQAFSATITSISGNGTTVTVNFNPTTLATLLVGETVTISGTTSYDGTFQVLSYNPAGTLTYTSSTSAGTITTGVVYGGDGLSVISNGSRTVITPRDQAASYSVLCQTQTGSPYVTIEAAGSQVSGSDTVYIKAQIAVGGLILFGLYPCIFVDGADFFQIEVVDFNGNPVLATSTVSFPGGGAVPYLTFSSASAIVTVTLAAHGFQVGDTFTVLLPTTAAGATIYGNYTVTSVISTSQFTFLAQTTANASASVYINSGNAYFDFYKTPGTLPTALGYGVGTYGGGGYGLGVAPTSVSAGNPLKSLDWTLDNWGQILIAGEVGGPIFTWDPLSGIVRASIITNAPPVNDGVFVAMPQRQIVAWGSTFNGIQDPLLLRWSDVDDYTAWTATVTNQAGSYRFPKGSKIVGCIQGPQQGIVWTDLAMWAMQYVGPPYVYQFNEVGVGCGLISRKAAVTLNGVIYWMSQSQFFQMGANGIEMIPCPIWDVIFQDLDLSNVQNVRVAANSYFGEVTWYYPTISGSGEPTQYVKYNTILKQWDFGTLTRTAWINQSVLGPPIGAGPPLTLNGQNYIYQHETSQDADGSPMVSSFQTGYFAISDGEWKTFVDQVWPDMKWGYYGGTQGANLALTFYVTDYPTNTPKAYGPYQINTSVKYVTPRFRGRLVSIQMQSSDAGSFWRIGATRYRLQQDGKF
jgi:hypothetical protein